MGVVAGPALWERQRGESRRAFAAFGAYRDYGPRRSLAKVARKIGKSTALLERWSRRWAWVRQATAWDDTCDARRLDAAGRAMDEMAERHASVACLFQQRV